MLRRTFLQCLVLLILFGFGQTGTFARADTITGVFTNIVASGFVLNDPVGSSLFTDNSTTAVVGSATPGGSACAASNTLCWGTAPDSTFPGSEQYSQLVFSGSSNFNPNSSQLQNVGTISFLNGTSDLDSLIFGATLTFYDNGVSVGSDNVIISTTSNQYSGSGLSAAQLATDADYINICGNNSNLCGTSLEAFEDSEGGTGLLVDLSGNLVGDPTLVLDSATLDPSQADCTTCGVVGSESGSATVTPEPPALLLVSTAVILCFGFTYLRKSRSLAPGLF